MRYHEQPKHLVLIDRVQNVVTINEELYTASSDEEKKRALRAHQDIAA